MHSLKIAMLFGAAIAFPQGAEEPLLEDRAVGQSLSWCLGTGGQDNRDLCAKYVTVLLLTQGQLLRR